MFYFESSQSSSAILRGPGGSIELPGDDEIIRKIVMLLEGHCLGLGPTKAAEKAGYTKARYFQILHAFREGGAEALKSKPRGPKTNYRRTDDVVRQVIRHRFLDPDASAEVIAQKLRQTGSTISTRSVERIVSGYGLQKKTPQASSQGTVAHRGDPSHGAPRKGRAGRRPHRRA